MEKIMLPDAVVIYSGCFLLFVFAFYHIFSKCGMDFYKKLILQKKKYSITLAEFNYYGQEELFQEYSRLPFVDFTNPPGFFQ